MDKAFCPWLILAHLDIVQIITLGAGVFSGYVSDFSLNQQKCHVLYTAIYQIRSGYFANVLHYFPRALFCLLCGCLQRPVDFQWMV